ncbi:MAG: SpoIIE family protein phosphatase [Bacteroidia bacterium]|nr:SpoIIE family protein phosphatase [Bacteroidia bacterium]MDW8235147.1 SpoIIE family protein phosphatase [Bacteroidia bacterium]
MSAPLVIGWLPSAASCASFLSLLQGEIGEASLKLFRRAEEAHAYAEKSILQGEEPFLFLARLPEGAVFLEELLRRWPLAYGIGLYEQEGQIVSLEVPYLPLKASADPNTLRFHLRLLRQRYEERLQSEKKNMLLSELHRVSLSLTAEVRLEWLIFKLLRIVLDDSQAQEAILLSYEGEKLRPIGYAAGGDHAPRALPPIPFLEEKLFLPLLEFVARSRENILLTEGMSDSLWLTHPQWLRLNVPSLLCLPLVFQGKLIGILYLIAPKTDFLAVPERMEFLKLITSHAAIALQNATLYAQMEAKVQERTAEVVRQKEEIERQSILLKQQNEDILASLRYAQRVQRAIFPSWQEFQQSFPDSFLFYQSREMVGGDFYWFAQRLSKAIIAVGDCTGHGIPGAFMTIIANTLLRQIVELEGVFRPSEILYLLNLRLAAALHHEDNRYDQFREGMELALLQVDPKRHKLLYAGAGRPLYIVRDGCGTELRPDRITLGLPWVGDAPEFTPHAYDLQPGDMLYLFSDGFSDQLNPEGKRYQLKRFYELLQVMAQHPAEHQYIVLEAEWKRWMENTRQTDDIIVIGVRVP